MKLKYTYTSERADTDEDRHEESKAVQRPIRSTENCTMADILLRLSQYEYDQVLSFLDAMALTVCHCEMAPIPETKRLTEAELGVLCDACTADQLATLLRDKRQWPGEPSDSSTTSFTLEPRK
jgi:hypothetical protein